MEYESLMYDFGLISGPSLVPDGTYAKVKIGLNEEDPQPVCFAHDGRRALIRVAVEARIIGRHQPLWGGDYSDRVIRCALISDRRRAKASLIHQLLRALGDTGDVNLDDVRDVRSRLVRLLSNWPFEEA